VPIGCVSILLKCTFPVVCLLQHRIDILPITDAFVHVAGRTGMAIGQRWNVFIEPGEIEGMHSVRCSNLLSVKRKHHLALTNQLLLSGFLIALT